MMDGLSNVAGRLVNISHQQTELSGDIGGCGKPSGL